MENNQIIDYVKNDKLALKEEIKAYLQNNTTLISAAITGYANVVRLLVNKNVNIDFQDYYGCTA